MVRSDASCEPMGGFQVSTVKSTNVFDEERVKKLLQGEDRDVAQALRRIVEDLRDGLCGWLRRHFPGLSPEDLADTWQETLVAVLTAVRDGRFDAKRPLIPWLCTICYRRATDLTRRKSRASEALAAVGARIAHTSTGLRWKMLSSEERSEVLELTLRHIERLPEMQRLVLQTFSDHYPESASMETLRALVSQVRGQQTTLASVKRALQEGRRKLSELLQRNGYHAKK